MGDPPAVGTGLKLSIDSVQKVFGRTAHDLGINGSSQLKDMNKAKTLSSNIDLGRVIVRKKKIRETHINNLTTKFIKKNYQLWNFLKKFVVVKFRRPSSTQFRHYFNWDVIKIKLIIQSTLSIAWLLNYIVATRRYNSVHFPGGRILMNEVTMLIRLNFDVKSCVMGGVARQGKA